MRIRLNDTVEIITGNRSGVKGKVTKVLVGRNKLYVEGINIYKKTVRGSGIVDVQRPIDVSINAFLAIIIFSLKESLTFQVKLLHQNLYLL